LVHTSDPGIKEQRSLDREKGEDEDSQGNLGCR